VFRETRCYRFVPGGTSYQIFSALYGHIQKDHNCEILVLAMINYELFYFRYSLSEIVILINGILGFVDNCPLDGDNRAV
jgi:hypothetical protein